MRRLNLSAFSLITAVLMAVAVVSPAAAQDQAIDISASARGISMPSPAGASSAPDIAYHGMAATNVTVGYLTTNLPCANCVKNGGTPNIGLPWPVFAVQQGAILTVTTLWESITYAGPCKAHLILRQGGNVIAAGSYPFPGGCTGGHLYGVTFTFPAPITTGFTTAIGTVTGGTNTSGAVTFFNVQ